MHHHHLILVTMITWIIIIFVLISAKLSRNHIFTKFATNCLLEIKICFYNLKLYKSWWFKSLNFKTNLAYFYAKCICFDWGLVSIVLLDSANSCVLQWIFVFFVICLFQFKLNPQSCHSLVIPEKWKSLLNEDGRIWLLLPWYRRRCQRCRLKPIKVNCLSLSI